MKKTPMYDSHVQLGGKMVEFAGYELPIQYKDGIIAEHMAVRTKAGLFDVSHMGEIMLYGYEAFKSIQHLFTNDFSKMNERQIKYTLMCDEDGGIIDDLLVYKIDSEKYMLVVNASNRQKDFEWIKSHLVEGEVTCIDDSDRVAQIALQGPLAYEILNKLSPYPLPTKYYTFDDSQIIGGIPCNVSRTGYTGEDGFEIYVNRGNAQKLWDMILDAGKSVGLVPCGLGARDTLRLEASMPLYGHEMSEDINPFEAGLSTFVKLDKEEFIGKKALIKKEYVKRIRVGFNVIDKGIVREGAKLYFGKKEIGVVTSGTFCPYLGAAMGMAIVSVKYSDIGDMLEADVRGRLLAVEVVPLPLYKRVKKV
jgi:aminomethyltransferase